MPVEIRELIIRAVVVPGDEDGGARAPAEADAPEADRAALVQECVRQVLKILERSRER